MGEFDKTQRPARVLIVEDSVLLAAEMTMIIEDAGFAPVGPARNRREARALVAACDIDVAVLDIDLGTGAERDGALIADLLCDLGIGFVFISAHPRERLDPKHRSFAHLTKPVNADALIRQLKAHVYGTGAERTAD